MSITFDVTERFPAPPDKVFAALTDLDSARHWMNGFVRLEQLTGNGFEVGTTWLETRKMHGKEATEHFEVTALDPPSHIGLEVDGRKGTSRKGTYLFDYRLEPDGDGTRVTLHGEIRDLGRFGGILGRMMVGPYRKACARDMTALRDHMRGA